MKNLLLLFLFLGLFSCMEREVELAPIQPEESDCSNVVTDANGLKYPGLAPPSYQYCGPGWGRKMCRFLRKYNGTEWTDAENYYSDFSDIKFSNFLGDEHFISFYNIDSIASYCEGWKLGETTNDRIKWNIKIKVDEEDVLWFDYQYYGYGEEVEYKITYKYEVIDGLLNFSSSDGQTFIFHPSEKNYSLDTLDAGNIIRLEGCFFDI